VAEIEPTFGKAHSHVQQHENIVRLHVVKAPVASQEGVVVLEQNCHVTGIKEPTLKSDVIECLGCALVCNTNLTTDTRELRQDMDQHTSKKFNVFEVFLNQHVSQTKSNHLNELPDIGCITDDRQTRSATRTCLTNTPRDAEPF